MVRPYFKAFVVVFLLFIVMAPHVLAVDKSNIKIKVLSGNGKIETAQQTADRLKGMGYDVTRVDLAARSDFTNSVLYYKKTFKAVSQTLAKELNILENNIRPLTWQSEYNIIIVSAGSPLSRPEPKKPASKKAKPGQVTAGQIRQVEENISFAVAEAHALFVNREYPLALEKYNAIETMISSAQKLCKGFQPKTALKDNKNIAIQVLSKNSNLADAKSIVKHLAEKGYTVSEAEYTLRTDLVEDAIYYASGLKENAGDLAADFEDRFALLPLQWPSAFQMIIVTAEPVSDGIQIIEMDEKISELKKKELLIKETIDLQIKEAFDLLAAKSDCREVQNKFEGIKTHLKRIASVCETARRLDATSNRVDPLSHKIPENITPYPATSIVLNLDEAVAIAVANNASVEEAVEKVNAAVQEKKSARSDFLPRAGFNYSYTRLDQEPTINFMGSNYPVGAADIYTWDLTLSQPIFTGFGLLSQYEIKKLNLKITEIQKKTAVLNLVKNVKQAYYDLLLAQKLVLVAQETVQNLASHKDDSEQFYKQGMIPYNDLLKAKVALANAVQEQERVKSVTNIAVASLNILLDYNVNQNIEVQEVMTLSPNNFQLTDLLHEAVDRRPELEMINLAVKSTDQAIRAAKSAYYPQVAVVGQYEQTGQDVLAMENDYGEVDSSSVTLTASWSLFKGGKTRHDVAKLEFDKKALVKQYEGAESNIQLEVKNIYENLRVSQKNIKTAQESVAQAKENWRITNLQFQEQIATSTDVLDARTDLSQAQLNYLRAHYGYMKSLADLERAVGKAYPSAKNETVMPPELLK